MKFTIILVIYCAVTLKTTFAIYGGTKVKEGDLPFMAFVVDVETNSKCGGTVIDAIWILTACHCVYGKKSLKVITGRTNLRDKRNVVHEVNKYQCYPGYVPNNTSKSISHDVALIGLKKKIENYENKKIMPVPLATSFDYGVGKIGTIAGWGDYDIFHPASSLDLLKLELKISKTEECMKYNKLPNTLCSIIDQSTGPKGFGDGDSGGPLMVDKYVTGVIIETHFHQNLKIEVYARVSYYQRWIDSQKSLLQ